MNTQNTLRLYEEPMTEISIVESEGFICNSLKTINYQTEVDEFVNSGREVLNFDEQEFYQ